MPECDRCSHVGLLLCIFMLIMAGGAYGSDQEPAAYDSLSALSRIGNSIDISITKNYVKIADQILPALWEEDDNFNYTLTDLFQSTNYDIRADKTDYDLTPVYLGSALWTFAHDIRVEDDIAYVCFGPGLALFDVSDPGDPQLLSRYYMQKCNGGIDVANGYLFMGDHGRSDEALWKYDVSDPYNIQFDEALYPNMDAWTVRIDGSLGYLCAKDSGLQIFNAFYPTGMIPLGNYAVYGELQNVELQDDYAYLSVEGAGLTVVDISDPANPIVMANDGYQYVVNLAVQDNYAYIAQSFFGFRITDISDPGNPTIIKSFNTPGDTWDLSVRGDYVYAATDTSGLQICDISDPHNITCVGYYNDIYFGGHEAYSIDVVGDYASLGDRTGMVIIDISDPTDPKPAGEKFYTSGMVREVKVRGNYAYLADAGCGMQVVDISDPALPVQAGVFDELCDVPCDIALYGKYAYIANGACVGCEVKIVDVSDRANMTLAGVYETPGECVNGIATDGQNIFVADAFGFYILDVGIDYICGDVSGDGELNLLDAVYIVNYLYKGGEPPTNPDAADIDGSGKLNLLDAAWLINFLYKFGPEPVC